MNFTISSCLPGEEYRDLVPPKLELEDGVHTRFEERRGNMDTICKVLVHRAARG